MAGPVIEVSNRPSSRETTAETTAVDTSKGIEKLSVPEITAEKLLGPLEVKPQEAEAKLSASTTQTSPTVTTHAELRHNNAENPLVNQQQINNNATQQNSVTHSAGQTPTALTDNGFSPWPITKKRSTGYADLDELLERCPHLATAVSNFETLLQQMRQAERTQSDAGVSKNSINNALEDIARELKGDLVADLVVSSAQVKQLSDYIDQRVEQAQQSGPLPEWLHELKKVNLTPVILTVLAAKLEAEGKILDARLTRARKQQQDQQNQSVEATKVPELPKTPRENTDAIKKAEAAANAVEGATRAQELARERQRDEARAKSVEQQRTQELERVQTLLKRWKETETREMEADLLKTKSRAEELRKEATQIELELSRALVARPELRAEVAQYQEKVRYGLEAGRQTLMATLDQVHAELNSGWVSDGAILSSLRKIPENQRQFARYAYQAQFGSSLERAITHGVDDKGSGLSNDNVAAALQLLQAPTTSKSELLERADLGNLWTTITVDDAKLSSSLTTDLERLNSGDARIQEEQLIDLANAAGRAETEAEREQLRSQLSDKLKELKLAPEDAERLIRTLRLSDRIVYGRYVEMRDEYRAVTEEIGFLTGAYDATKGSEQRKVRAAQQQVEQRRVELEARIRETYGADQAAVEGCLQDLARTHQDALNVGKARFANINAIASKIEQSEKAELFNSLKGLSAQELRLLDERVRAYRDGHGLRDFGMDEYAGSDLKHFFALVEGRTADAVAGELAQAVRDEDRDAVVRMLTELNEVDARRGDGKSTYRSEVIGAFDRDYAGSFLIKTEQEHIGFSGTRDLYRYNHTYAQNFSEAVDKQFGAGSKEAASIATARNGDRDTTLAYQIFTGLNDDWGFDFDSDAIRSVELLEAVRDPESGELDIARLEAINNAFVKVSGGQTLVQYLEAQGREKKSGDRISSDRGNIANWGLAILGAINVSGENPKTRSEQLEQVDARAAAFKVLYACEGVGTDKGMLARAHQAPPPLLREIQRVENDPNASAEDKARVVKLIGQRNQRIDQALVALSGYNSEQWVKGDLNSQAAKVQIATIKAGYENDGLKLNRLMGGSWDGTENEKEIRRILEKHHAQGTTETLEAQFAPVSQVPLLQKTRDELGGDDLFHAEMALVGLNENIRSLKGVERAEAEINRRIFLVQDHLGSSLTYKYRDTKLSLEMATSAPVTGLFSAFEAVVGTMSKSERKAWEEELARANVELSTVRELRESKQSTDWRLSYLNLSNTGVHKSGIAYIDARAIAAEAVGDKVCMIVTTGGTVVAVVMTAGTGGVVIGALKVGAASALGAVAGNTAGVVTKTAISGRSGLTNWDKDLAKTGADALTQGVTGTLFALPLTGVGAQAGRLVDGLIGREVSRRTGAQVLNETGQILVERGAGAVAQSATSTAAASAGVKATAQETAEGTVAGGIRLLSGEVAETSAATTANNLSNESTRLLSGNVAEQGAKLLTGKVAETSTAIVHVAKGSASEGTRLLTGEVAQEVAGQGLALAAGNTTAGGTKLLTGTVAEGATVQGMKLLTGQVGETSKAIVLAAKESTSDGARLLTGALAEDAGVKLLTGEVAGTTKAIVLAAKDSSATAGARLLSGEVADGATTEGIKLLTGRVGTNAIVVAREATEQSLTVVAKDTVSSNTVSGGTKLLTGAVAKETAIDAAQQTTTTSLAVAARETAEQTATQGAAESAKQAASAAAGAQQTAQQASASAAADSQAGFFQRMTNSAVFKRLEDFAGREWEINRRLAPYAKLTEAGAFGLARQNGSHILRTGWADGASTIMGNRVRGFSIQNLSSAAARVPGQIVQGSIDGAGSAIVAGTVMRAVDQFDLAKEGDYAEWLKRATTGMLSDAWMGAQFGAIFGGVAGFMHSPASSKRGTLLTDEAARKACDNAKFGASGQRFLRNSYAEKGYVTRGDLELAFTGRRVATQQQIDAFMQDMGITRNPEMAQSVATAQQLRDLPSFNFSELSPLDLNLIRERHGVGNWHRPDAATALTGRDIDRMIADSQTQLREGGLAPEARAIEARRYQSLQRLRAQFEEIRNTYVAQPGDVTVISDDRPVEHVEARRRTERDYSYQEPIVTPHASQAAEASTANPNRTASGAEVVADVSPTDVASSVTPAEGTLPQPALSNGSVEANAVTSSVKALPASSQVADAVAAEPAPLETTVESTTRRTVRAEARRRDPNRTSQQDAPLALEGRVMRADAEYTASGYEIVADVEVVSRPAVTSEVPVSTANQIFDETTEIGQTQRACAELKKIIEKKRTLGQPSPALEAVLAEQEAKLADLMRRASVDTATIRTDIDDPDIDGGLLGGPFNGGPRGDLGGGGSGLTFGTGDGSLAPDVIQTVDFGSGGGSRSEPGRQVARALQTESPVATLEPHAARTAREDVLSSLDTVDEDAIAASAGSRRFETETAPVANQSSVNSNSNTATVKDSGAAEYAVVDGVQVKKTDAILKAEKEVSGIEAAVRRADDAGRNSESLRELLNEATQNRDQLYRSALSQQRSSAASPAPVSAPRQTVANTHTSRTRDLTNNEGPDPIAEFMLGGETKPISNPLDARATTVEKPAPLVEQAPAATAPVSTAMPVAADPLFSRRIEVEQQLRNTQANRQPVQSIEDLLNNWNPTQSPTYRSSQAAPSSRGFSEPQRQNQTQQSEYQQSQYQPQAQTRAASRTTEFAEPPQWEFNFTPVRESNLTIAKPVVEPFVSPLEAPVTTSHSTTSTALDPRVNTSTALDPRTSTTTVIDSRVSNMTRLYSDPRTQSQTSLVSRPQTQPHPQPKPDPLKPEPKTRTTTTDEDGVLSRNTRRLPPGGGGQPATIITTLDRRPQDFTTFTPAFTRALSRGGSPRGHGRRVRLKVNELGVLMLEGSDSGSTDLALSEDRLYDHGNRSVLADRDS